MTGADDLGWWGILIAVFGGAIRVSTPYLFVSLGETLTEKGGRVNLGLEGILVMGAMSGYGVAVITGEPWLGVLAAGLAGASLALLHGLICNLPRVNDIAVGISLFVFGTGLAFFLGKDFIHPSAPRLPYLDLGAWSAYPQVRSALEINSLFLIGMVLAPLLAWGLKNTKWGLILRTSAIVPKRQWRWVTTSILYAHSGPWPGDFSPVSAVRSCRCIFRALGTRDCPAARD